MSANSPAGPFRSVQFTGQTAGNAGGTGPWINCRGFTNLTVYVAGSAALSAGTLIVEEASWDPTTEVPFPGTASQITSVTLSSPFASAGGQYATHCPVSAYAWVRTRIGTSVVGGTISVDLEGC
jgi:hypothetical protein